MKPSLGPISPPQFAEGRLTYIGIALAALGMLAGFFGMTWPKDEADGFASWLAANWDTLSQGVGLIIAVFGRARINWRERAHR